MARAGLYRAKWSRDIHEEWIRAVLARNPQINEGQLRDTAAKMDAAVLDSSVTGYESLVRCLSLPDENDRHVLGAAIVSHSGSIVTFNKGDFPTTVLAPLGLVAVDPDEFVCGLIDLDIAGVYGAAEGHRARLMSRLPLTPSRYLDMLAGNGLPESAEALRKLLKHMR